MTTLDTYKDLMRTPLELHTWIKGLSWDEKILLIDALEKENIPVMRSLSYDYETQQWVK